MHVEQSLITRMDCVLLIKFLPAVAVPSLFILWDMNGKSYIKGMGYMMCAGQTHCMLHASCRGENPAGYNWPVTGNRVPTGNRETGLIPGWK
jgi:hypothetical protein